MYLHSLKLKNFKGFRGESEEIYFHGPNGDPGSGLNILVGENNAGKSTLLDAICFLRDHAAQKKDPTSIAPSASVVQNETSEGDLPIQDECAVIGEFAENSPQAMLANIETFTNSKHQKAVKALLTTTAHIRCRRHWQDQDKRKKLFFLHDGEGFDADGRNPTGLDVFLKGSLDFHTFWADDNAEDEASYGANKPCLNLLTDILKQISNTTEYAQLQTAFQNLFVNQNSTLRRNIAGVEQLISSQFQAFFGTGNLHFEFPQPSVDQFVKALSLIIDLDYSLALSENGHGVQRIAALALLTAWASVQAASNKKGQKPYIFLLDEPELCLHPRGQAQLLKALLEISRHYQVFVTTHSPIFLHSPEIKRANLLLCRKVKSATVVSPESKFAKTLPYSPTWGEICWFAYNMPTVEFHNELYGFIQEKSGKTTIKDADELIRKTFQQIGIQRPLYTWTRYDKNNKIIKEDRSLSYYVRNAIHHPDNPFIETGFVENHLEESINDMLQVVEHLQSCSSTTP